jgi:hypothetical protein
MELLEKLKVSDGMGAWIDDFKKSDAPQFKGKNEKEKRDMAIAAYLSAKRGDQNESDASWKAAMNKNKLDKLSSNDRDKISKIRTMMAKEKKPTNEVKMVPGFVRPDGTRTSKPTKAELGKTPEYHAMKKNVKSEGEAPFKGPYKKNAKPLTFKQAMKKVKGLAAKGMKNEAKTEIDHTGEHDPFAKKHNIKIKPIKGHDNPYAHHASGTKSNLKQYLTKHYKHAGLDASDAADHHPHIFGKK